MHVLQSRANTIKRPLKKKTSKKTKSNAENKYSSAGFIYLFEYWHIDNIIV